LERTRVAIATVAFLGCFAAGETGAQVADTSWTVRGGTYDGAIVRIDPVLATAKGSRFWRVPVRGPRRIIGWNPSRLPVAVAFRQRAGFEPADSAAFWAILRQLEADAGLKLFEPATLAHGEDPPDVIVVDTRQMPSHEGMTLVTWTAVGSLYDARVHFRSRASARDPRVVTHEIMHALGFGHTTAWPSVMSPSLAFTSRLTLEDVAYLQAALESRAITERSEMWARLALATAREASGPPSDRDSGDMPVSGRSGIRPLW
jgi:hypothetical protein